MARLGFTTKARFNDWRGDFELARRLGCDLDVVVVSLDGLDRIQVAYGRAERRLVVIEAAEIVRNICADVELAGRIDEERLAVAALGSASASLRIVRQLRAAFRELAVKRGGRYRPEVIFGSASLRESGVQHWEDLLLAAESARTGAALTVVA